MALYYPLTWKDEFDILQIYNHSKSINVKLPRSIFQMIGHYRLKIEDATFLMCYKNNPNGETSSKNLGEFFFKKKPLTKYEKLIINMLNHEPNNENLGDLFVSLIHKPYTQGIEWIKIIYSNMTTTPLFKNQIVPKEVFINILSFSHDWERELSVTEINQMYEKKQVRVIIFAINNN
jgi:hypothetical protein